MKILLAESNAVDRRLLTGVLTSWGYEVVLAADGDQAHRILEGEDAPRLAILDWAMPRMNGIHICWELRRRIRKQYVYIILLTAVGRDADLVQGLAAGADDYLAKPFDERQLVTRLSLGERVLYLQDQLRAARATLEEQAIRDSLTGLWNRPAALDMLRRELARVNREGGSLGLILADLDHFKRLNNTHGHKAGDTVLRQTADRIQTLLRPYDMAGRYGGEEFLLVLPGCDAATTMMIAERVRDTVSQPVKFANKEVAVTASLGVAASDPGNPPDLDALLANAHDAVLQAKHLGGNRAELWEPAGERMEMVVFA